MIKFIWKILGDRLTEHYVKSQNKPYKFSQLEYRLTDSNGNRYYGFPENLSISEDRYNKLQEFLIWLSNGLTPESLNTLIDKANKAIEDGVVKLANNKRVNMIKVGAVLHEIKTRQDMIKPAELLYNIIAVQLIREDEDPMLFNNSVHLEKVEQIKAEKELGNSFFFSIPESQKVWKYQSMSEAQWTEYLDKSEEAHQKMGEMLEYL